MRIEGLNILTFLIEFNRRGMTVPVNLNFICLISVNLRESIKDVRFLRPAIFKINRTVRNRFAKSTFISRNRLI